MATLVYELPETYASVTRPVAYEIVKQLRDNLGILNKNIAISFPGANGKVTTWNANNIEETDSFQFSAKERLMVDIKEDYIEDDLLTMMSRRKEYPPIFLDKGCGVMIHPVYSRTKVVVSFTYRTKDRWQAENLKDYWRRKIADNREYMVFNARYKYPIPEDIEKGLWLLHRTRSVNLKDCKTYQDYLATFGSKHLVSLKNAAGTGDILAMAECQENIYGNFTDPTSMDMEKDELGAVWNVTFDFEYHYDKPISVVLTYPLLIHNELIPPQLYPEVQFDIATLKTHSGLTRERYTIIEQHNGFNWHIRGAVIRIPEFDDWSSTIKLDNYKMLLSAMMIVDPEHPREVCNLKDMGEWGLHPVLHPFFSKNSQWLNVYNESPFYVQIYENNAIMEDLNIVIDHNLNVETKYPMKLHKMYHMTISVHKDIKLLSKAAQYRFFSDPVVVNAWLDIFIGHQPINGYPKVNPGGFVDIKDFDRVIRENGKLTFGKAPYYRLGTAIATVGIFNVATHNQNEIKEINEQ